MENMRDAAGWKGLEPTLGWMIRRGTEKHPQAEALVADDRRYTYALLSDRINRLANALSNLGVRKGEKVGLILFNGNEFVEAVFAIAKLGAVTVPLNYRLQQKELEYILNHSDVVVLIHDREFDPAVQALKPKLPRVRQYVVVGKEAPGGLNYEKMLAESASREPEFQVSETDPASLIYTSGTTGLPKGAMLSHRNHLWSCLNSVLREGDYTLEKKVIIPIPLFHMAGFQRFLITLFLGGKNIMTRAFDPAKFLALIQREGATATLMVPTQITMLTRVENIEQYDRNSIAAFQFGAAPSGLKLLQEIGTVFPRANCAHCYGITETCATASYLPAAEFQKKMGSVGRKGHGYLNIEVKVLDEGCREVKPREVGEIVIRGPNVMMGYYKDPEATTAAFYEGGWYKSGDLGMYDEDGYLFIVDRKKDMIISGGENIYSPEVENVLTGHPRIAEASVIGFPDDLWGEVVRAIVVPSPGQELTAEEVIEYCKTRLAGFKCPKSVVFVKALPVNAAGKVLKTVLRAQYGKPGAPGKP